MPRKNQEALTKVTFKIPKELDEALELQAHQWRLRKREAAIVILEEGLKRATGTIALEQSELA